MQIHAWKPRSESTPRTTCDQCGRDYAETPEDCVTVTVRTLPLFSETICRGCVPKLGITGCAYRDGEPVESLLGTAAPPPGWRGRRTTIDEILDAISNGTYRLPKPAPEMGRLDLRALVDELWRTNDSETAAA